MGRLICASPDSHLAFACLKCGHDDWISRSHLGPGDYLQDGRQKKLGAVMTMEPPHLSWTVCIWTSLGDTNKSLPCLSHVLVLCSETESLLTYTFLTFVSLYMISSLLLSFLLDDLPLQVDRSTTLLLLPQSYRLLAYVSFFLSLEREPEHKM